MYQDRSPIIDFYPTDFKIDMNGKKFEWMGVALLPFVDEERLKRTLKKVYNNLTLDEQRRNTRGENLLFISRHNELYPKFSQHNPINFKTITFGKGFSGAYMVDDLSPINVDELYKSPIPNELHHLKRVNAVSFRYRDHKFPDNHIFISKLLPGAKLPPKVGLTLRNKSDGRNGRGGSHGVYGVRPGKYPSYILGLLRVSIF